MRVGPGPEGGCGRSPARRRRVRRKPNTRHAQIQLADRKITQRVQILVGNIEDKQKTKREENQKGWEKKRIKNHTRTTKANEGG